MSADIHPFHPDDHPEEDAPPVDLHGERSVYLDAYLAPFREWLECDTVTEILVNRPGEVWVEDKRIGQTPLESISVPIGAHEIRVTHPELGERRLYVDVTLTERLHLTFDFTK